MIASSALSCANTKTVEAPLKNPSSASEVSNNSIGLQNDASLYTELSFNKGTTQLSNDQQMSLKSLVKKSTDSGQINELKVIAWGDVEHLGKKQKKLSNQQKRIADLRNHHIEQYLNKNYPHLKISSFNMAKKPNLLQSYFNTADARTKKTIELSGKMTDVNKESTVLVLSILK